MTQRKSPTMNGWKSLYQAAEEFKNAEPCQWAILYGGVINNDI